MSPDERDFDAEGADELLYEEIRAAYDRVSLPPHLLRAMRREAERSPAGAPMRLVTGALLVLAAVLTLVLVALPAARDPEEIPAERVSPATPEPIPEAPEPPEVPLVETWVELWVRSDVPALVFLDGAIQGYTPQVLQVRPGRHELRATPPGYEGGLVQVVDAQATGEPVTVAFTFRAPPERNEVALQPPNLLGVWLGSTKPRDLALKFVVERQAEDGTFVGIVSMQLDDGTFVEFEMAGQVERGGALSFRGLGMTFTGRIEGRGRASGTYTARTGAPSAQWSVMRAP